MRIKIVANYSQANMTNIRNSHKNVQRWLQMTISHMYSQIEWLHFGMFLLMMWSNTKYQNLNMNNAKYHLNINSEYQLNLNTTYHFNINIIDFTVWSILNTKLEHEYCKFLVQYINTSYNNTKTTSPQIKY